MVFTFYLIKKLVTIVQKDIVRKDSVHFPKGAIVMKWDDPYTGYKQIAIQADR